MKKKFIAIILMAMSFVLFCGCGSVVPPEEYEVSTPADRVFTKQDLSITLTDEFSEVSDPNFFARYDSDKMIVLATKDSFTKPEIDDAWTVENYADMLKSAFGKNWATTKTEDNLVWFEYSYRDNEANITYYYYTYFFKTVDAFCYIQFTIDYNNNLTLKESIKTYAKSITFEA